MPLKGKRETGRPGPPSKSNAKSSQPDLPGVEQEKIPYLERLIRKYQAAKLDRMEASKVEVAAKGAVIKAMKNNRDTLAKSSEDGFAEVLVYKRPGRFKYQAIIKVTGEKLEVNEVDEDVPEELEVTDDDDADNEDEEE